MFTNFPTHLKNFTFCTIFKIIDIFEMFQLLQSNQKRTLIFEYSSYFVRIACHQTIWYNLKKYL